jgi:acyl-CoA thioesterase
MVEHPLDEALSLDVVEPGRFHGRTTPQYWNMAGPFGGVTGALMLRAVLDHPEAQGRPVALTVNFCGAVAEGDFEITARLVRGGRSTQHWQVEMTQEGRGVATTASVVMGVARETWGHRSAGPPSIPAPEAVPLFPTAIRNGWTAQYEMRFAAGAPTFPQADAPRAPDDIRSGLSHLWVRDAPPRPLDYPALAALSDSFILRIVQVRGDLPPTATATLTTYFLADPADLARQGGDYLLGVANSRAFAHGFHDQIAELWSRDGELLAVSTQMVWFKS